MTPWWLAASNTSIASVVDLALLSPVNRWLALGTTTRVGDEMLVLIMGMPNREGTISSSGRHAVVSADKRKTLVGERVAEILERVANHG